MIQGNYTGVTETSSRAHANIDDAIKQSGNNQIKIGEFKLTKQQEFQKAAKAASEGVSRASKIAGGIGTGVVMGLGMTNPITAGLVVGSLTAGGGLAGKKFGKSGKAVDKLQNTKYFKDDANEVLSNINKKLTTDTIVGAVMAGATAHGAGAKSGGTLEAVDASAKTTVKAGGGGAAKLSGPNMNMVTGKRINPNGGWMDPPTKFATDWHGVGKGAESTIEKVAVPDIASGGTPSSMLGKLKNTKNKIGDFLTSEPGDYKRINAGDLFQGKEARSQFSKDFVGNLKASASQYLPGGEETDTLDVLTGGKTLFDWYSDGEDK
tara:strand:- start:2777 stop:3739 length:963 start_codon:yes stop_codon:yes gene_type:complete